MSASILVTGGAGYIGSHTVRALRDAGEHVVVLDTLELGRADAVGDAELVVGDIADHDLVVDTCRRLDVGAIVHFAAYKNVGESMRSPSAYYRNNVDGTRRLLDAAIDAGIDRIVFSSSCSVHGTPAEVPVVETAPIHPESVYAETKAVVERMLHWYDEIHGVRSVSLRYFNAAGASFDASIGEDWSHALNLVPVAIRALLTGDRELEVYGDDYPTPDGTCIRDYIHVVDLADAHLRALAYLERGGRTTAVNVGTGIGTSVREVLDGIEAIAGRRVPHRVVGRRAGDPVEIFADPAHAREVLGWEAEYGLEETLTTALRWHERQLAADGDDVSSTADPGAEPRDRPER